MEVQLLTSVEGVGSVYSIGDAGYRIEVPPESMEILCRALGSGLFMIEDVESKVVPDAVINMRIANSLAHEVCGWEAVIEASKTRADHKTAQEEKDANSSRDSQRSTAPRRGTQTSSS